MGVSEWLMLANIVVSAIVIGIVGFGVYWLQNRKEDLRLKRDVFRRVVGNIHGILYDCRFFQESHSFSESGIVANQRGARHISRKGSARRLEKMERNRGKFRFCEFNPRDEHRV